MLCTGDCLHRRHAYSESMDRKHVRDMLIVGFSLAVSLLCLTTIPKLKVDSSTDAFIPLDSAVVRTNDRIEAQFGSLDTLVVSLYEPNSILQPSYLAVISDLTARIEALDGVKQATSLTNLKHLQSSFDGVDVVPLYEGDPSELEARLAQWPEFYDGMLISSDRKVSSILIQTTLGYDATTLLSSLKNLLGAYPLLDSTILGMPVVTEAIRTSLLSDLAILAPIVSILIMLVLYLFLRSIRATILSLVPLLVSSSLALGLMALFGITFTMATMLVPVLLLIVGSAYTIHIFSHFFEQYGQASVDVVLHSVVKRNTYPIIAAAATTASGFLAQLSSPLGPFRTFGLLSFIGVGVCAFSSLVLLPALIRLVYRTKTANRIQSRQVSKRSVIPLVMTCSNRWGIAVLLVSYLSLFILLPFSYSRLEEGTNMLAFFRPSSALVQDSKRYNQEMQGSFSLTVMLGMPEGQTVLDPRNLFVIEQAVDVFKQQNQVGGVQSILPFIKRMNQLLGPKEGELPVAGGEEPTFDFFNLDEPGQELPPVEARQATNESTGEGRYEIPMDPQRYGLETDEQLGNLIAQYLLLYSSSLDSFINDPLESDTTVLTILLKNSDTQTLRLLTSLIPTLFPSSWKVDIGGGEAVSLALTDLVTKSQMVSLFSSLIAVWVLVLLTFRSVKLAFLSLTPCLFALAAVFSSMALLGIKLDIITSLLSALAIGVGVDYAIHLLSALQRDDDTLEHVLKTTGKAILANAASVALAFTGLLFSRFTPIAHLGLLFCIAMVSSALSTLLLLPAIRIHFPKLILIRRKLV